MERILEFNEWNNRKLAVLHMKKSPHKTALALKELSIPFDEFEQEEVSALQGKLDKYCGLIIGGGKLDKGEPLPTLPNFVLDSRHNKLGICLGHEILGTHLGAKLIDCNGGYDLGEFSEVMVNILPDEIFGGLDTPSEQMVKMEHFYMLEKEPPGSKLIASTDLTPIAGFHHGEKKIWGVQFHPEKDWIKNIVLKNFYNICKK